MGWNETSPYRISSYFCLWIFYWILNIVNTVSNVIPQILANLTGLFLMVSRLGIRVASMISSSWYRRGMKLRLLDMGTKRKIAVGVGIRNALSSLIHAVARIVSYLFMHFFLLYIESGVFRFIFYLLFVQLTLFFANCVLLREFAWCIRINNLLFYRGSCLWKQHWRGVLFV